MLERFMYRKLHRCIIFFVLSVSFFAGCSEEHFCSHDASSLILHKFHGDITAISAKEDRFVFAVGDSLFTVDGRGDMKGYKVRDTVTALLLLENSKVLIGTKNGVLRYDLTTKADSSLTWPSNTPVPCVTALQRDKDGTIIVGTARSGVFDGTEHGWTNVSNLSPINDIAVTMDSSRWYGTDIGLFRMKGEKIDHYKEEGLGGLDIPDNIIEQLHTDDEGNMWVVMSAGLSFFPRHLLSSKVSVELPSVDYIGDPNNTIYDIVGLPDSSYLFSTEAGFVQFRMEEMTNGESQNGEMNIGRHSASLIQSENILPQELCTPDNCYRFLKRGSSLLCIISSKGIWTTCLGDLYSAIHRNNQPDRQHLVRQ